MTLPVNHAAIHEPSAALMGSISRAARNRTASVLSQPKSMRPKALSR